MEAHKDSHARPAETVIESNADITAIRDWIETANQQLEDRIIGAAEIYAGVFRILQEPLPDLDDPDTAREYRTVCRNLSDLLHGVEGELRAYEHMEAMLEQLKSLSHEDSQAA